ncbi:antimicrobial peptide LCI [Niallia circulans]|uniref:LCI fold-containing protein n=1 Tax=Niallia circulans TaxID=1397 RepID=UPI00203F26F1|nr:LCI fold-containing protein [Niallia circulans]MCM2983840.1 antimicrobial peptide LCI [Niallia circulans]
MIVKKIAISAIAALALAGPAIPSFASASANTESQPEKSVVAPLALVDNYVYKKENVFANSYTENGITWYLKGITYSGGYYIGHYQANI